MEKRKSCRRGQLAQSFDIKASPVRSMQTSVRSLQHGPSEQLGPSPKFSDRLKILASEIVRSMFLEMLENLTTRREKK